MMTALLSVGAWAENLWNGSETLAYYGFQLTGAVSMSAGDVLTFTVTETTTGWAALKLKANDMTQGYATPGTELISTSAAVGTVKIVVTSEVAAAAAADGLWLDGNDCTVTSVDLEKKQATLNLYSNEEGTTVNYWGSGLSKVMFGAVQTGDLLTVTIKSVGADWGANVGITTMQNKDAEGNVELATASISPDALPTTVKIAFTDAMVAAAKSNGLYLNYGTYTYTSVDIVYAPMLANAADNTDAINYWQGISTNVTLADRTLTKDGDWNTLCLPFALTSSQIDASPLADAIIKELNTSSSSLASDGTLTLNFTTATEIVAGKPYIVKWTDTSGSVENPLFEGVTITATTPTAVKFSNAGGEDCQFVGQFSPFTIDAGNKDEIIMLGSGSQLGYSQTARDLKTFRAHFFIPGATAARAFVMNFGNGETTGIISVQGSGSMVNGSDAWYSLGGQRLQSAPTAKGVYIQNGRKVVVK